MTPTQIIATFIAAGALLGGCASAEHRAMHDRMHSGMSPEMKQKMHEKMKEKHGSATPGGTAEEHKH